MSLWTPDGDIPVNRRADADRPDSSAADGAAGGVPFGDVDLDRLSPEDRERAEALAAEMAQARAQLLAVPAGVVVANHAMGLYELAAIHLGAESPDFSQAQVAIDAFGALVDTLGDRLGPDAGTLRDALAQIRLAFVQIKAAHQAPAAEGAAASDTASDTTTDDA